MARPKKKREPGELYREKATRITPDGATALINLKPKKRKIGAYGLI